MITALNNKVKHDPSHISRDDLSILWDHVNRLINQVAKCTIPNKQVKSTSQERKRDFKTSKHDAVFKKQRKDIRDLRKIFVTANNHDKRNNTGPIEDSAQLNYNLTILKFNALYETSVPTLPSNWNRAWTADLKQWIRIANKSLEENIKQAESVCIKDYITDRCSYIANNQKKMLNSLLNRDFRKIVIDRVKRTDSQGNIELLTDPKDIHDHADATYAKHFRKRNHLFDSDTSIWRQWENEYSPKPNIDPAIFSKLATEPTKQEWLTTLQACKNSSAAGLSGIGYKMLKHLPECLNRSLRKLSFICFNSGLVSEQWKWSQVYPIPKPSDWNFNLDITRPILLLECCRKLTVKILTQRLSDVCRQHNVLKGNNYAALKGGST
jgi:hypothetical protein